MRRVKREVGGLLGCGGRRFYACWQVQLRSPVIRTRSMYCRRSLSTSRDTSLHGPHHVAVKYSTIGNCLPPALTAVSMASTSAALAYPLVQGALPGWLIGAALAALACAVMGLRLHVLGRWRWADSAFRSPCRGNLPVTQAPSRSCASMSRLCQAAGLSRIHTPISLRARTRAILQHGVEHHSQSHLGELLHAAHSRSVK